MSFKPTRREPTINMEELAKNIKSAEPDGLAHLRYAPPAVRDANLEPVVNQVKTFGELPTKELDDVISAARAELANLERDAQAVRDLYAKHTARIAADIERLQKGVRLAMQTMNELRKQCIALDNPIVIEGERNDSTGDRAVDRTDQQSS